jgi:hypothetical protein
MRPYAVANLDALYGPSVNLNARREALVHHHESDVRHRPSY